MRSFIRNIGRINGSVLGRKDGKRGKERYRVIFWGEKRLALRKKERKKWKKTADWYFLNIGGMSWGEKRKYM